MNYVEDQIYERVAGDHVFQDQENEFVGCRFISVDFSHDSLRGQHFIECQFENCNMSNTEVLGAELRDVTFSECKLVGIHFCDTNVFDQIVIKDSIINYSIFHGMKLKRIECINSTAYEVDFSEADMEGASFQKTNLRGSSFTNTNLSKADFRGALEYSINPNYSRIAKARFSLPDAVTLLEAFDIILE